MIYIAQIQSEFIKHAKRINDMSPEERQLYFSTHKLQRKRKPKTLTSTININNSIKIPPPLIPSLKNKSLIAIKAPNNNNTIRIYDNQRWQLTESNSQPETPQLTRQNRSIRSSIQELSLTKNNTITLDKLLSNHLSPNLPSKITFSISPNYISISTNYPKLYHFTNYESILDILSSNKLWSTSYDSHEEGVSFTTNPNLEMGSPVRITVNKNKILQHYKTKEIPSDQNETRILGPELTNLKSFITKITLFPNTLGQKYKWNSIKQHLIPKLKQYNIPISIKYT